jgi:hypothetical protein
MESGYFYTDITNDSTPLITVSGETDNGGSGLHTTAYYYQWRINGGEWSGSGYIASNTYSPSVSESQDVDFSAGVRDAVGNVGTFVSDSDNTVDLADPSFTNIGGSESSNYLYTPSSTTDYGYYSDNMGASLTDFNVIGDVTDNYGLEKANGSTQFSDTPQDTSITGTSDAFSCTYTINDGDLGTGDVTVTIYLYDQAGNVVTDTFTFYEDNTAPSISVTWNFNVNDWCIKSGTDFGFIDIDVTSVQDIGAGLEYGFFYVYNSSGIQSSVRFIVQGLNGDTSEKSYLDEYWYPTDDCKNTGNYIDDEYDLNDLYVRMGFRDMCANYNYPIRYVRLDRTVPGGGTLVMASGWFYVSITNDSTPLLTASGASDAGSGLHPSTRYQFRYRIDDGGWNYGGWQLSNTYEGFTISDTQNVDFGLEVMDVVGNVEPYVYDFDNIVDLTNPSFTNIGGSESSNYLHAVGATIDYGYYSDNMGSTPHNFYVIGDITDNFGLELANATALFGDLPSDNSITGTSDSFSLLYDIHDVWYGYGDKVCTVYLFDQAGNVVTDTYTFYEDNSGPNPYSLSTDELYNWGVAITVSGSTTDALSGLLSTNAYEWWINSTRIYGTQYTTTSSYTWTNLLLGPLEFCGAAWDNVGNFQNATTTTIHYVYILVITNPQPEIEEIEDTGYYNEEDVYYNDVVLKITSVEEVEQTKETDTIVEVEVNALNIIGEYVISKNKTDSDTHIVLIVTKVHKTIVTPSVLALLPMMLFFGRKKKKEKR